MLLLFNKFTHTEYKRHYNNKCKKWYFLKDLISCVLKYLNLIVGQWHVYNDKRIQFGVIFKCWKVFKHEMYIIN